MAIPTKLPIKFSCGHTETKDLSSTPAGKRKSRAFGLGKNFVCSRCFRKQGQESLEQLNREILANAMAFEEDHSLPELQGSEKQVAWATKIRYEVLSDIVDSDDSATQQAQATQVLDTAHHLSQAGWWIDNCRDTSELDTDDLIELITTAVDESETDHIQTENPF